MSLNVNSTAGSIDFGKTFGGDKPAAQGKNRSDLPKAQVWINIGYTAPAVLEGEDAPRFISLPMGIPLDTQEKLAANSRNANFAKQRQAQNGLLDQLMQLASQLAPGQTRIVNLEVELRRVNEELEEAPVADNPFMKTLSL